MYEAALRTPLVPLPRAPGDPEVFLKLETLQPIGSFKLRGAYNAVRRLSPSALADGVWTVSAGNAAQGVAFAARRAGAACRVLVMDTAPRTKLEAIERLGATIVQAPYDECWRAVETHVSDRMHGHLVHPFDDDDFISGNGTIALEIVEDLPDVDAVIAPLGGGGLLGGVAVGPAGASARTPASTRPSPRQRRRSPHRSPPARAARFESVDAVVRRRRRAAGRCWIPCGRCCANRCRIGRREPRRRGARDEARRRSRARDRGRGGRLRRRRGPLATPWKRAAIAASLPSCPAATSTWPGSRNSSAPAPERPGRAPKKRNMRSDADFSPGRTSASSPPAPELANDLWWTWNSRRRARSSAGWTTRCGGRPPTTR